MPLIEINQSRQVSAMLRLDSATAALIDQYATFIHASADDVIDKAAQLCVFEGPRVSGIPEDRAVRQCCTHSAGPQEWEWGSI